MKRIITTMVLLLCAACFLKAQNITVIGMVYEIVTANGQTEEEGLVGVCVNVMGDKDNWTLTDFTGEYSITCPANATLVYSCMGFYTETEDVEGRRLINVQMTHDSEGLEATGQEMMFQSSQEKQ